MPTKSLPVKQQVNVFIDGERYKRCPACTEYLPKTEEFYQFIYTRGHFHAECKMCRSEKRRLKREAGKVSGLRVNLLWLAFEANQYKRSNSDEH